MSYVITRPGLLTAAAGNLSTIGASMSAANAAVEGPTTQVVAPAADQVSALVATQFAAHGLAYQTVALIAGQIHEAFASALAIGGTAYAVTEATNIAVAS
ncbi:PE family protein [Mycobacterium malmoense]|uniref:PE family protein n=1 Tax=Mycobacterium malmoense TaxID=1780 RepID=UPI0008F95CE7|nr:PE family protein [Mycobacterium malmoense]OIN78093.1 PE family protein [Mycobacterium malmoense]